VRSELAVLDGVELVAVAFKDAARVGVDDEDGVARGVQEDGVGGFWADAVDSEELVAQRLGFGAGHFPDGALIFVAEELDEGFQFFGLVAEIAGGGDQLFEAWKWDQLDRSRSQQFFAAEIFDCRLDVGPRSVLDEYGADDDFEGSAAGPPVLRAVGS